jgi:hypothetical protein
MDLTNFTEDPNGGLDPQARMRSPESQLGTAPLMRLGAGLVMAALSAGIAAAAPPPKLDMTEFFTGRTHADNVMNAPFVGPTPLIVDSVGHKEGDQFVLIDTVHEGKKPVRMRKWVMRADGPNHYKGTLTDAVGPVDIAVAGNGAVIRYKMKGGLNIEELIELQPGGRVATNRVVARKFGMRFAKVEGTIRKLD